MDIFLNRRQLLKRHPLPVNPATYVPRTPASFRLVLNFEASPIFSLLSSDSNLKLLLTPPA